MTLPISSQIWHQNEITVFSHDDNKSVRDRVATFLQEYLLLWWNCERSIPQFTQTYTTEQQKKLDAELDQTVNRLLQDLKHIPDAPRARDEWLEQHQNDLMLFAEGAFLLEPAHLAFIEQSGMVPALKQFAIMAREFDASISAEDIYQAGRNVMTANFIQVLLDIPVEVTPSIFAYSMLYPYTDNYLDDPAISSATKLAFNQRFRERIEGKSVLLANNYERTIDRLIGQIESQWNRADYPQVYESLLAIHTAQTHSLRLVDAQASPFELDVLGISFEKGGTSVLADGYLVAGNLSLEQARVLFGFGAFTQLVDDLEDLFTDQREGRQSVFSMAVARWPLDRITNQFIHFGKAVLSNLPVFPAACVPLMSDLTNRCIDPVLIDRIALAGKAYGKDYLKSMQCHIPFSYTAIERQRKRFKRQNINLSLLLDTFFL